MTIDYMQIKDFPQLYSLWKKVGLNVVAKNDELKELNTILKVNGDSCFVIKEQEKILGGVIGTLAGAKGWISHMAIEPKCQGTGHGTVLLEKSISALKKQGAGSIFLMVRMDNLKVVPFYEKYGFSIKHSMIMKKDLKE